MSATSLDLTQGQKRVVCEEERTSCISGFSSICRKSFILADLSFSLFHYLRGRTACWHTCMLAYVHICVCTRITWPESKLKTN